MKALTWTASLLAAAALVIQIHLFESRPELSAMSLERGTSSVAIHHVKLLSAPPEMSSDIHIFE